MQAGAPLVIVPADPSLASLQMVGRCRPTEQENELGMQIGKQGYPSMDEANIDLKVVCDNS
jgi:hypothetical protein